MLGRVADGHTGKRVVLAPNELLPPGNRFSVAVVGVKMRTLDGLHLTEGAQRMLGNWLWAQLDSVDPLDT